MRAFWTDLSKLNRPLMLWLTFFTIAISILFAYSGQDSAARQLTAARSTLNDVESGMSFSGDKQADLSMVRAQVAQATEDSRLAAATQEPLGALGIAVGMTCSVLGAFMLLVATSGHVAAEWTGKTMKETLIADGRRRLLACAKLVSMFLFAIWLVVWSWVGVALWGLLSKHIYAIGSPADASKVLDWILPMLWKAPLVIVFFAALALVLSVAIRNSLGTVLVGSVFIGGTLFVSKALVGVARFSPASWLAAWMNFQSRANVADHIWVNKLADQVFTENTVKVPHWSWGVNALLFGGLTLVLVVFVMVVTWRRDALS